MSNLAPAAAAERCVSEPAKAPAVEALPGRLTDVGGLPIRRLLPRSRRRLVGAWCFLDSYGPLTFSSRKAMDVAPHPHIGLQTVSWLLDGELIHHDSLGREGAAGPGVLNLMTAGRGIAHAEETRRRTAGACGVCSSGSRYPRPAVRPHPPSTSITRCRRWTWKVGGRR